MAHFAELDQQNVVLRVVVINDADAPTEEAGVALCEALYGGRWKQTSYNTHEGVHGQGGRPLRANYATVGGQYDEQRDAFILPKPFLSWTLNEATCTWRPPKPFPPGRARWNEDLQDWEA